MRKYLYIALGGAAGAILRYLADQIPITDPSVFPVNTLLVNIVGSFALTLFVTLALQITHISAPLRLGVSVGLLGGFTTFSTFCKETGLLFLSGSVAAGIGYFVLTPLLGLAAGYLGIALAGKIVRRMSLAGELKSSRKGGD